MRMKELLLITLFASASNARAQDTVLQPAETMRERGDSGSTGSEPSEAAEPIYESDNVGTYNQPRWTASRRFPTTRVYVAPKGQVGFEWWLETKLDLSDTDNVRHRSQFEFEFGLGSRLQLDVYLATQQEGWQGPLELHSEKVELRYALGDWDAIPLNPTLYLEYARVNNEPDVLESKLLFGGEFTPHLFWGANLVWEHQLAGDEENEYALTGALSYEVLEGVFSLGAEAKFEVVDHAGHRFDVGANHEFLAGPSLQWRPFESMHIDLVALLGFEKETSGGVGRTVGIAEPTLVIGAEI